MALVLTLAVVPFGRTVLAGLRGLPDPGLRPAGALAAGTALVWLAALTLPHLPAWGPVLLALCLGVAATAILGVTRQAAGSRPWDNR
jgi:hypothetical protein